MWRVRHSKVKSEQNRGLGKVLLSPCSVLANGLLKVESHFVPPWRSSLLYCQDFFTFR